MWEGVYRKGGNAVTIQFGKPSLSFKKIPFSASIGALSSAILARGHALCDVTRREML